jgi:transcriptional regulator with XRE-family HTH domain
MNESIHERINQLLQQKGINAAQFADTIGVQRSSMSHLLSGRNKPSIEFLEKCLIKFPDIDIIWLITGKHSLHSQENNTQLQLNVVNSSGLLNQASLFDAVESKTVISSTQKQLQKKSIERIVTFYSDKTFTEYIPE